MTETLHPTRTELLRRAAARARLAPSVHNTQPWRFVIQDEMLEIHADYNRQLRVLDPARRQLIISCGCAVLNARTTIAAAGYEPAVERFPDVDRPQLVARLFMPDAPADYVPLGSLDPVIEVRRSNRREFSEGKVPADVLYAMTSAAQAEGVRLVQITSPEHRLITAQLSQRADELENRNPAYRAELRAWTSDDPRRRDGVPAMVVPHVDASSEDDIPIRDFDTRGMGWLPTATRSSMNQCLLLLGSERDDAEGWLRTGEALERLWLEATRNGYVASLLTQVVEVPLTRARLREQLALTMYPHVLLRVGRAPATLPSQRRRLDDVLVETYRQELPGDGEQRA